MHARIQVIVATTTNGGSRADKVDVDVAGGFGGP